MNPFSSARALALVGLFLCGWAVPQAHAATFTIQTTADTDGSSCGATCTLRQALNAANATSEADTLAFAPAVFGSSKQTIALSAPLPEIGAPVTLTGPSTSGAGVTLDAGGKSRILSINAGASLTLSHLTLTGGRAGQGGGSAIYNVGAVTMRNCTLSNNLTSGAYGYYGAFYNGGTATLSNCTFSNNTVITYFGSGFDISGSGYGGAIGNRGTALTLSNCTFSNCSLSGTGGGGGGALYNGSGKVKVNNCTFTGNSSNSTGGAICNGLLGEPKALLELSSCTLTGNTASRGGAILNFVQCTLRLSNSIVVGNRGSYGKPQDIDNGFSPAYSGTFVSGGHNLVGAAENASFAASDKIGVTSGQVKLGALGDNGGPTQTLALFPGSIAIDAGKTPLTTDQRGFARSQGSSPDIGAFEFYPLPTLSVNSPSVKEGNAGTTALTFTLTLSRASKGQVSVLVNTHQDSAKADSDYVSVGRGTVTFAPGVTHQTFTVQIVGDTRVERDEQFRLDLRSPVNATLDTPSGIGTILNDDSAPKSPTFADSGGHS